MAPSYIAWRQPNYADHARENTQLTAVISFLSRPVTTVMIPEISTREHAATPRAVGRLLTLYSEWVHDKYSENGPRPSRPRRHSPERERL